MVFSRTWNAAYEAQPADTENISLGASRIRDLKADIQERLVVDHSHAGNADDGKHTQVTFLAPLGADPANLANHGFLYTKDVNAKVELFWIDEDGNVLQITLVGALNLFPSGTSLLFHQTAAPPGWTKQSINDKALRVVSGTAGSGGADAFSAVFAVGKLTGGRALTAANFEHKHETPSTSVGGDTSGEVMQTSAWPHGTSTSRTFRKHGGLTSSGAARTTLLSGPVDSLSSSTHDHTLTMDLQFEDVIIADKD